MIYLDNSATTRVFDSVIEVMTEAMASGYYNPSALYAPGLSADKAMDEVREKIAAALGDRTLKVVFTAGGTESNNLALRGLLPSLKGKKGHYITTSMEHPSILRVMETLEAEGHRVDYLSVEDQGHVDLKALAALLTEDTTLVSIMQVNNETGAMQNMEAIGKLIRSKAPRCLFHIDGVQGFMREPISLTQVGADLYSLSAHKIHGPKGIGALVMSSRAWNVISPILHGGGQESGMRSGTPNVPGILGLGKAVEEFETHGDLWRRQLRDMKFQLVEGLSSQMKGVYVNGPSLEDGAGHILSLAFDNVRGEVLLHALEGENILVATGSACSSHSRKISSALVNQGVAATRAEQTIRISLGVMNTPEEIETVIETIRVQATRLARFRRR